MLIVSNIIIVCFCQIYYESLALADIHLKLNGLLVLHATRIDRSVEMCFAVFFLATLAPHWCCHCWIFFSLVCVYIDGWGFPTELNVSCCYFLDLFSLSVGEFLEINVSKNISLFLIVVIIIKSHNYIFLAKMQTLLLVPKLQNFFKLTSHLSC